MFFGTFLTQNTLQNRFFSAKCSSGKVRYLQEIEPLFLYIFQIKFKKNLITAVIWRY